MSVRSEATGIVGVHRIGEVARICGVSTHAIRLAEREHRIPAACREGFGSEARIYGEDDVYALFAYFHRRAQSVTI